MLTPEQLDHAQCWLGNYYADEDPAAERGSRLPHDDDRKTCRDALVSYKKMLALLDEWAKEEDSIRIPERFAHEVRLALERGTAK
jgi:hypothetical protein